MFLITGFLSVFLLLGLGTAILPRLSDASFSSCSQRVHWLQSPGSPLQEKYIIFKPCKTLILLFYITHCLYRFTYIFIILFIHRCFEFSLLWVYFDKCFHFCHKMTILPLFLKNIVAESRLTIIFQHNRDATLLPFSFHCCCKSQL